MSSSRIEHVFYNAHSKVSHYVLRHTSHRLRSAVEHAALGLAVCGFCVVILSHRTFVHREDVASIARGMIGHDHACAAAGDGDDAEGGYGLLGSIIGEGRGVSVYAVVVSMARTGYAWMVPEKRASPWSDAKKIPGRCLKNVPGFRQDADVNHILLRYKNGDEDDDDDERKNDDVQTKSFGSQAFTIHRGGQEHETIVSGMSTANSMQQSYSCTVGASPDKNRQRTNLFGFSKDQRNREACSPDISSFLHERGYLPTRLNGTLAEENQQQYSSVIYSYSHSQGFLHLQPSLLLAHNISTQFIITSSTDPNCFGEPFVQSIIFRLVGPDTVVLNWILGLQHDNGRPMTRFVYHPKTKKELDLDVFDMDHYAFASKSKGVYRGPGSGIRHERVMRSAPAVLSPLGSPFIAKVQKYPMYHFLRFLSFKFLVLLSTLLIFFLTTSLVSFTFQETQDRMLEFTLQLQTRVRARMPLGGLILGHVLENLVFVPIMVGMVFFLIEFYEDKFLAFMVLSMVWVCEVFSAIRSAQGMHFFPRVFFLYFTLFHVYLFSCPIGFTYASLASTILFLFHTMLFFWNRYELPALHAGLITPQSPRMARFGEERGRETDEANNRIVSPPRIQPALAAPQSHQNHPPEIPLISSLGDPSNTLPTAPLSYTSDFTPQSDQAILLPPMRSYIAAASTSLQSIRSLASIQSSSSFPPERTTSPNFIFQGGYIFNDPEGSGDGEEDSYIARVMSS